ncbi:MAG: sigma 54-interacting transcriptional regulator [Candidatus Omnitrophica bacterium]|nr:sigma 54-interacting transcriptional regulator [Candidatus Omnitrophota bacterium]
MAKKQLVVIGLLGSVLDRRGRGEQRWERWRPSVALHRHEDLLIDRFEMIHEQSWARLADSIRKDIGEISPETEVRLHPVELEDPWDFEEVYGALHQFTRSYPFDTEKEDYLVHITTGTHVIQICLFLLTEARYIPGRLIQTSPPKGGNRSGSGDYSLVDLDLSRYDGIAARFKQETRDDIAKLKSGIETRNEEFNRLIEQIEKVSIRSHEPILLMGPTGAGKSQLAKRIFEIKKERQYLSGQFVEVNCATLRGDTAMATLFGHTKGAFTGATEARAGLLRQADSGVLFLDEIGEIGLDEQAMLLRAIEEKRFLPLGSDTEVESDFQLICGTNRDLHESAAEGNFREDLLSRIDLWTYRLPGLADRVEDIEPNLDYELNRYMLRNNLYVQFSAEAREEFLRFATSKQAKWSANFRDLIGAVTRMATLAPGGRITEEVVQAETESLRKKWSTDGRPPKGQTLTVSLPRELMDQLDDFDRVQLEFVLTICRECRSLSEAGRRLYAVSRSKRKTPNDADRLRKYLARFGLSWEEVVAD